MIDRRFRSAWRAPAPMKRRVVSTSCVMDLSAPSSATCSNAASSPFELSTQMRSFFPKTQLDDDARAPAARAAAARSANECSLSSAAIWFALLRLRLAPTSGALVAVERADCCASKIASDRALARSATSSAASGWLSRASARCRLRGAVALASVSPKVMRSSSERRSRQMASCTRAASCRRSASRRRGGQIEVGRRGCPGRCPRPSGRRSRG